MTTPPVNSPAPTPTAAPSTPAGPPDLAAEMERLFQEQQAASQSAPSPHAEGPVGADPAQVASTDPAAIGTDPAQSTSPAQDPAAPHLAAVPDQPYDPFATATPPPGQPAPSTPTPSPYDEVRQYLATVDDAALESLLALQQWAENLSPAQVELINQVLTSGEGEPGGSAGAIASNGQHNPVGPPSASPGQSAPTLAPSDYDDMDPALAAELRFLREQYARLEQQLQPVQTFTQQQIQQQQQQESAYAIQQFAAQYNFTPEEMAYLSQRIQNSATLEAQYRDTGSVGQAVFNSLYISAATNPTLGARIHQVPTSGAAGPTSAHVPPAAPDPSAQPPVDPAFARRAAAGQLAATPGSIPRVPPAPQTPHDRQSALADALRATGQFG